MYFDNNNLCSENNIHAINTNACGMDDVAIKMVIKYYSPCYWCNCKGKCFPDK